MEDLLDIKQVMALLRVSRQTLYRWMWEGRLPFAQPGGPRGRILIRREDVDRLLTTTPQEAAS